jgi:tryptophan-rich sensory protein
MTEHVDPFAWVALMRRRRERAKAMVMVLLAWVAVVALVSG